jgi:hypothetical protein
MVAKLVLIILVILADASGEMPTYSAVGPNEECFDCQAKASSPVWRCRRREQVLDRRSQERRRRWWKRFLAKRTSHS